MEEVLVVRGGGGVGVWLCRGITKLCNKHVQFLLI